MYSLVLRPAHAAFEPFPGISPGKFAGCSVSKICGKIFLYLSLSFLEISLAPSPTLRVGEGARDISKKLRDKYKNIFPHILETEHPANFPGEIPGKGSNAAWAGRKTKEYIDSLKIPYENILVSSFDIDTQVPKQYFLVTTYHFLT